MNPSPAPLVVKRSRYAYAETLQRLTKAITDAGNTIFASIDQAAAATSVGMTLRPTTLLVFGNPRGGTPLMAAFPLVALYLPLKLLVWEEDGVSIAYADVAAQAASAGVPAGEPHVAALTHALDALSASVSAA